MVFQSENTCSIFIGTWIIHSPTSTYCFCNFTLWLHKRTQTIAVIPKMQQRAAGVICRNVFCGWPCFIYRNVSGFLGDGTWGLQISMVLPFLCNENVLPFSSDLILLVFLHSKIQLLAWSERKKHRFRYPLTIYSSLRLTERVSFLSLMKSTGENVSLQFFKNQTKPNP